MAARRVFVLATLLLAGTFAHGTPVKTCQELLGYTLRHQNAGQDSGLCTMANSLKDLGCFCGTNADNLRAVTAVEDLSKLGVCFPENNAQSLCSFPSLPDLIKQYSVVLMPGVLSLPGLGMVKVSALEETASVQRSHKLQIEKVEDDRPVLDLSSLNEQSKPEVVMIESKSGSGDLDFNIDIGIPRAFLEEGVEVDLDIEGNETDDVEITLDSEFEIDVTYSSESELEKTFSGKAGKDYGSLRLSSALLGDTDVLEESSDLNIIPALVNANRGVDEVTIEMDIEIDSNSHIHDAVITVRDDDAAYPITGSEVGGLLSEISGWLWSQNSPTIKQTRKEDIAVQGVLRGVSKLLADVGEQIGDIMPNQELYNGQSLEIIAEEDHPVTFEEPQEKSGCMYKALARAASSVMSFKKPAPQEGDEKCKLCAFVDKHLYALWSIVIMGSLYVTYTLLLSFYQFLTPNQEEQTSEADDLKKPLILYASDFAEPRSEKEGFEPYCGPITDRSPGLQ